MTAPFFHLKETESTNLFMRKLSEGENLASGSVVLADLQTAGRGLYGNSWESEGGKNLTFSVMLHPVDVSANQLFVISEMVALSIKQTLEKYFSDITVKWPNDIYYGEKKIAGILIENVLFDGKIVQSIVGIGINVNQTAFLSDAPNPVSMALITGEYYDRMDLLGDFREIFAKQCERLNSLHFASIHNEYLNAIYRKDGFHKYQDAHGVFEACIDDIEPSGHLILKRTDGVISRYNFKEVMLIF